MSGEARREKNEELGLCRIAGYSLGACSHRNIGKDAGAYAPPKLEIFLQAQAAKNLGSATSRNRAGACPKHLDSGALFDRGRFLMGIFL